MEKTFMEIALEQAILAGEAGEVPVGAVIVDKVGNVIAHGQNSMRRLKDPTAHAEIVAIREAGIQLKNERLMECDLYVTLEPCPMCVGALYWSQIGSVVYGAKETRHQFNVQPRYHPKTKVIGGILEEPAEKLIHQFFELKRSLN